MWSESRDESLRASTRICRRTSLVQLNSLRGCKHLYFMDLSQRARYPMWRPPCNPCNSNYYDRNTRVKKKSLISNEILFGTETNFFFFFIHCLRRKLLSGSPCVVYVENYYWLHFEKKKKVKLIHLYFLESVIQQDSQFTTSSVSLLSRKCNDKSTMIEFDRSAGKILSSYDEWKNCVRSLVHFRSTYCVDTFFFYDPDLDYSGCSAYLFLEPLILFSQTLLVAFQVFHELPY